MLNTNSESTMLACVWLCDCVYVCVCVWRQTFCHREGQSRQRTWARLSQTTHRATGPLTPCVFRVPGR